MVKLVIPIKLRIESKLVIVIRASPSFQNPSFWYPFLELHLSTYHSTIGVRLINQIRVVYLKVVHDDKSIILRVNYISY